MIVDVPRIKVSGITYPVYAVDYNWGGADAPSTMTVDFVNDSGVYKTPKLGTSKVARIEIGFFSFLGYPVSFKESFSNKGNLITVTYVDKSVILDKVFVGLRGVHGTAPQSIGDVKSDGTNVYGKFDDSSHFVLLGSYVDPCYGVTASTTDVCSPCLTQTEYISTQEDNVNKHIQCENARFTSLLDVNYTFIELIQALKTKGISFPFVPSLPTNSTYYGRYSGTARDVLKSWCSDLGMTFYWDGDSVNFISLAHGITIDDSDFYTDCNLIERGNEESIEDNRAEGNILYFGAEGDIKNYDCANNSYKLSLIPVTLKDIFSLGNGNLNPYIAKYYTRPGDASNISGLQIACTFSNYARIMRDMVLFYSYYQANVISDIPNNTDFPLVGMKIKATWNVAGTLPASDDAYTEALSYLFWNHIPESTRKRASFLGASMAVIEWNDVWHNKFYEFEKALAKDFIGQYWISFFSKGDKYNYSPPDGDVKYYDAGGPMALPFIQLMPKSMVASSPYLDRIINSSAALNKSSGHVGDVTTANPNSYANSFLLMHRSAAWEPTGQDEDIRKFENNYKDVYFYKEEPFKFEGYKDLLKDNEYFVLIFDKPGGPGNRGNFDLVDFGAVSHPTERNNKNLKTEINGYTTNYGLRSDLCKQYQLQLDMRGDKNNPSWHHVINFFMPVQSYDSYGVNFGGYTVIASQNSATASKTNVLIRRTEVIKGDISAQDPESVGVIINFKDLSAKIQSLLTQTSSGCGYNVNRIKSFIDSFQIASARPKQVRKQSKTYTISGFPTRELTAANGLSGLSIRYDSSSGISTSVEFANTPPITKSETVIDQEVEAHILKRLLKSKSLSSNDKIFLDS